MGRGDRRSLVVGAAIVCGLAGGGCALGPRAIEKTHGPYTEAVQRVDEEQVLRNLVRIRYLEAPTTLDVASIAAQYEINASAEARPFFEAPNPTGGVFRTFASILPFVGVGGANRPTVSLIPQDDGSAVRRFLTPISPETLVFLTQAGWPVSSILRIWVDRLNGVPQFIPTAGPTREGPADFERFLHACALMQRIQDLELGAVHTEERAIEVSGPLPAAAVMGSAAVEAALNGMEYRPHADGETWALVRKERHLVFQVNPSGRGAPELAELASVLNLQPELDRYDVAVASGVPDPLKNPTPPSAKLLVTTRSTAQAYFFLANGVEVPGEHIACGLVPPPDGTDLTEATRGILHVHVCKGHKPPRCAYIAVRYRGHWFYIDDSDRDSKATLLLMLELGRLDFKRQQVGSIPALTLAVGR